MTKTNRLPALDRDLLQHIEDYLVRRTEEAARLDYLGEVAPEPEEIEDMFPGNFLPVRMPKRVLDGAVNLFDGIDEVDYEVRAEITDAISCFHSKACGFEEWDTDYGTFLMDPSSIH
ncbi:unnamed protein product [Ciceribacter sp. T2.26MG-112.2]|uniref:hypothetical protein n=1 Tax=Ciceribacter sp. T2.26MG-112.2 TaxID=3137154 RepID=UPI000E19CA62|nr:hypothetical protein [Ciceribacter naphthalenivorans]SSC71430.1 unnamed protein product [Ciceribacter naphthalenivorans]